MLLLFALLPFSAASNLKAKPFGQNVRAETLVALPTPAAVDPSSHERIEHSNSSPPYLPQELSHDHANILTDDHSMYDHESERDLHADPDEEFEDDYNEFGHYHPIDSTADQTLVRRAGLEKRAIYRGVMQMDCFLSAEACQNACWYQNCIRAGLDTVYEDGGGVTSRDNANRIESGVTTTHGRPCTSWPFGQKFYDTYQFIPDAPVNSLKIQTDEWPMASFENAKFDPKASPAQTSLRCITGHDNNKGSNQWTAFRRGSGVYAAGGKYEDKRLGSAREFNRGDTFRVAFDFSNFEQGNAEHDKLRK